MISEAKLVVAGLNHKTASVEIREGYSLSSQEIEDGLNELQDFDNMQELVVLSTCNRSEIYAVVDKEASLEAVCQFLSKLTNMQVDEAFLQQYGYVLWDEKCIEHLLRVTASLDSLVLGEGQILSQVKHAYALALENGATDTVLNLLFHCAIATGKRVRSETRIAFNAVSVSYAAVELAKNILGTVENCRALLFGAGKMAELTAEYLLSQGAGELYVANRHLAKAELLAQRFKGKAVDWTEVYGVLDQMDIIITSTGAPHYVIHQREVKKALEQRQGRPVVLIDIAVPRDVEPEVGQLPGVSLYNIDDLESVVDDNLSERQKEAVQAEAIVREETQGLIEKYQYLSLQPVMSRLAEKAEQIRTRELRRAMSKLGDLNDDQLRAVEQMTKMIVRKLLREPMSSVHDAVGTDQEQELKDAMQSLFQLDDMGNEVDADE